MPAVLDAKEPKRLSAGLGKPKRAGLYLQSGAMRPIECHADKSAVLERLEQVPDVCSSVRVRSAGHFVVEARCSPGKDFSVARFRNEDVDVLVLECGTACEQVLVP